jgi:hypothetical protein
MRVIVKALFLLAAVATAISAPPLAHGADDPCATVLKSMKAQVSQKAYRIRTTDLDPDTGNVKSSSSAEVQPPDRMHLFNDGGEQLVVRGKGTFTKAKGESWKKSPFDLIDAMLAGYDPKNFQQMSSDCHELDADKLDGRAMKVWQFKSSGLGVTSMTRIWIADSDGLPYQMEIDGKVGALKTKTKQRIEYDPSIKIEAPN